MFPPMMRRKRRKMTSTSNYKQCYTEEEQRDITILMGDFNAKIGMGQHGLRETFL